MQISGQENGADKEIKDQGQLKLNFEMAFVNRIVYKF